PGRAGHRTAEQAQGLRAPGRRRRYRRGERATRLQARLAQLWNRRADPARPGAQVDSPAHRQPAQAGGPGRLRPNGGRSRAHPRAQDGRESRIPRDQAGEARTLARALMPEFTGSPDGQGRRIAVVVSRFNEAVTQCLVDGAMDALTRHGVAYDDIDVVWVPGAWELPAAARALLASERYHALVALGAVIRGDTPH